MLTLSDSKGFLHDPAGMDQEKIDWVKRQKGEIRGNLADYVDQFPGSSWHEGEKPWGIACDVALPCATQNEMDESGAKALLEGGCKAVSEGANMPVDLAGVKMFKEAGILYAPKASNAGGGGLWLRDEPEFGKNFLVRRTIAGAVEGHHERYPRHCATYGAGRLPNGECDYVKGANIAGFVKVADAMLAFGVV